MKATLTVARIANDSPFCEAYAAMDKIVERLLAMAGEGATTDQVTQLLTVDGTALLREMLQGYLDRCAKRERHVEVVGADGIERREVRKASRRIETPVGEVEVRRMLYQAPDVDGFAPLDAAPGLPDENYTHEVAQQRPAAASPLVRSRSLRQALPIISCSDPSVHCLGACNATTVSLEVPAIVPRGQPRSPGATLRPRAATRVTASRKACGCEPQGVILSDGSPDRVLAPDEICPQPLNEPLNPLPFLQPRNRAF